MMDDIEVRRFMYVYCNDHKGQVISIEFLKLLLELVREVAQEEKEIVTEEIDKGKDDLTELFNVVRTEKTLK